MDELLTLTILALTPIVSVLIAFLFLINGLRYKNGLLLLVMNFLVLLGAVACAFTVWKVIQEQRAGFEFASYKIIFFNMPFTILTAVLFCILLVRTRDWTGLLIKSVRVFAFALSVFIGLQYMALPAM